MKVTLRAFSPTTIGLFVPKADSHKVEIPSNTHWRVGVGCLPVEDEILDCPTLVSRDMCYLEASLPESSKIIKDMNELGVNSITVTMDERSVKCGNITERYKVND